MSSLHGIKNKTNLINEYSIDADNREITLVMAGVEQDLVSPIQRKIDMVKLTTEGARISSRKTGDDMVITVSGNNLSYIALAVSKIMSNSVLDSRTGKNREFASIDDTKEVLSALHDQAPSPDLKMGIAYIIKNIGQLSKGRS